MASHTQLTDTRVDALKPPATGQDEYPDHRIVGLRLRIGASGKKAWIVRKRVGDKLLNKTIGSYPAMGLGAARKAACKLLDTLHRDGSTVTLTRTFGEVATHWIENVAKPRNSSWRLQERRLEMHIYPEWKDRPIAEIRRSQVRDLIDGLEGDVLPNRILATAKTIFRYAMARDWVEASPVEGIDKLRDESSRDRVLSMHELKRLWAATSLLGYPHCEYVRMLTLTAQRRTEVAAMKWADVDLESGIWILTAASTKSQRAHAVPLAPNIAAMLRDMPRFGPYLFSTDGKTHISGYAKMKAKLDGFITATGTPIEDWRLHDLRRSAATHMVRLGISEEVVGRVLNHAKTGVTAKVYALHSYLPEKRSALARWTEEILRTVNGSIGDKVTPLRNVAVINALP